jgi:hypothetical protein
MAFALHLDGYLRALLTETLDLGTNEGPEIIDKQHLLKLALPPLLLTSDARPEESRVDSH